MKELFSALCKAQHQIRGAVKDSRNPHFNSMFANLESVVDALRQPLFDNGLCFVQSVDNGHIHTIINHTSGDQIVSTVPFVGNMPDMQKVGAALTYARRQGLCTAFGVPQIDLDGNDCVDSINAEMVNRGATLVPKSQPAPKPAKATPKTDKISADLAKELGTPAEVSELYPLFVEGRDNEKVLAIAGKLRIDNALLGKHKVKLKQYLSETRQEESLESAMVAFFKENK